MTLTKQNCLNGGRKMSRRYSESCMIILISIKRGFKSTCMLRRHGASHNMRESVIVNPAPHLNQAIQCVDILHLFIECSIHLDFEWKKGTRHSGSVSASC